MSTPSHLLAPTPTMDFEHPAVREFALEHARGAADEVETAVRLFRAVRDSIPYDPYTCFVTTEDLRASTTLAMGRAWCVPKAILLAASWRAVGIPSRLGFADVRNHLSTEKLRELMGTDVYAWHGYALAWLRGRWVKATPAFDTRLCERFGLRTVEWDGVDDSLLHPTDASGRDHLDYVRDRGEHDDAPVEAIRETFDALYPRLLEDAAERRVRLMARIAARGAAK